jgi:Domain of unknown function (DUF4124)
MLFAAVTAAVAMTGFVTAQAATYKWVDDQGVVHYTDKVPPESVAKGATVLDKQGRQVKKIEPSPTPDQLKAKQQAEDEQRVQARLQADQARKDKALIQSYTTEQEIDVAKSRALATIDSQIKSAQAYSVDLARRLEALKKRKASFGDKAVPADVERDLNTIDVELARQQALIQQKTEEIGTVTARYDADKKRWHDIKADQQRSAVASGTAPVQSAPKTPALTPPAKK